MPSPKDIRQFIADCREIERIERDVARRRAAERVAARFEAMNAAQARQARRHLHVSAGLALASLVALLAIFHDAPARTAATVLEAQSMPEGW